MSRSIFLRRMSCRMSRFESEAQHTKRHIKRHMTLWLDIRYDARQFETNTTVWNDSWYFVGYIVVNGRTSYLQSTVVCRFVCRAPYRVSIQNVASSFVCLASPSKCDIRHLLWHNPDSVFITIVLKRIYKDYCKRKQFSHKAILSEILIELQSKCLYILLYILWFTDDVFLTKYFNWAKVFKIFCQKWFKFL